MNQHRKIGLFFAAAALIFVILLHGPWTGYDTYDSEYPAQSVDTASLLQYCQMDGKALDPDQGAAAVSKRFADELACVERLRPSPRTLPLAEWRTLSPVLPWFGNIMHVCATVIAILVLAFLWLRWRPLFHQRSPTVEGK